MQVKIQTEPRVPAVGLHAYMISCLILPPRAAADDDDEPPSPAQTDDGAVIDQGSASDAEMGTVGVSLWCMCLCVCTCVAVRGGCNVDVLCNQRFCVGMRTGAVGVGRLAVLALVTLGPLR